MADREHTKQPVEEIRPVSADAVPAEEDLEQTDVGAGDVDTAPEEHLNRPDQPDFDPAEREQYENPPVETSLADSNRPEDH